MSTLLSFHHPIRISCVYTRRQKSRVFCLESFDFCIEWYLGNFVRLCQTSHGVTESCWKSKSNNGSNHSVTWHQSACYHDRDKVSNTVKYRGMRGTHHYQKLIMFVTTFCIVTAVELSTILSSIRKWIFLSHRRYASIISHCLVKKDNHIKVYKRWHAAGSVNVLYYE